MWTPLTHDVLDLGISMSSVRPTKTVLKRAEPSREWHMACLRREGPTVSTRPSPGEKAQEASQPLAGAGHHPPPGLVRRQTGFQTQKQKGGRGCCREETHGRNQASWAAAEGGLTGGHEGEKAACTGSPQGQRTGCLKCGLWAEGEDTVASCQLAPGLSAKHQVSSKPPAMQKTGLGDQCTGSQGTLATGPFRPWKAHVLTKGPAASESGQAPG